MIRIFSQVFMALGLVIAMAFAAEAQGQFSSIARIVPVESRMEVMGGDLSINLGLSQPVPWRLRYLADPPRLVVDFREVDFTGLDLERVKRGSGGLVKDLRAGPLRAGWSRLVVEMDRPRLIKLAEMKTDLRGAASAALRLRLAPAEDLPFREEVARPDPQGWALPHPAITPLPRAKRGDRPMVIVLDPGHGGIDPGAQYGGKTEADLMLTFARELKETIRRRGLGDVVLTRDSDVFIPLESRIAIAHRLQADVFLSLHADASPDGKASGATLYSMSHEASDEASAALAERHDRDSLMSGVDLTGEDDLIAGVLMDMARRETAPRTEALAKALLAELERGQIALHKRPLRSAAFSVLKAPDIVSLLFEVGYISSPADLKRLENPVWRGQVATAVAEALAAWQIGDAAQGALLRQ